MGETIAILLVMIVVWKILELILFTVTNCVQKEAK